MLVWQAGDLQTWVALNLWGRVSLLVQVIMAGAVTYFISLFLCGAKPHKLLRTSHI
jgi:hypothetical protein